MKKRIFGILLILGLFLVTGCCKKEEEKTPVREDAIKFKTEYEALNGKTSASGMTFRKINISEDNPFVYTTAEDIVEKIKNEETFYLYVGDKQCPWCRSSIEKAIEVANKKGIDTIYYINIWDDDHNEILRDKYALNKKNKPEVVNKGTDAYYELLKYFNDLLPDYTLTTDKNKTVKVGEKRIFAPNYFYVKDGKALKLTNGTSEKQETFDAVLTEDILKDQEDMFLEFFDN